jgi:uncharacterized pyridoxal phosphate-containing UPF0001 family protein
MAALTVEGVRANLDATRARVAAAAARAGRDGAEVEILAAVKYLDGPSLEVLADAGVALVGENRAQDLLEKVGYAKGRLRWHFIGALQSRKVKLIVPHVELIHSVASHSALAALGRCAPASFEILVEVNVAGEPGKAGIAPRELDAFIASSPVKVVGLMTMPPQTSRSRTGPSLRSWRRWRASAVWRRCRLARARTTRSRSRLGRRSCGSARACIAKILHSARVCG